MAWTQNGRYTEGLFKLLTANGVQVFGPLASPSVTVPTGYTGSITAGNVTVSGPPAEDVAITVKDGTTTVGSFSIRVPPAVGETDTRIAAAASAAATAQATASTAQTAATSAQNAVVALAATPVQLADGAVTEVKLDAGVRAKLEAVAEGQPGPKGDPGDPGRGLSVIAQGEAFGIQPAGQVIAQPGIGVTATVAANTDLFTRAGHGLLAGQAIVFQGATTPPTPLTTYRTYFLRDVTANSFKVALTDAPAAPAVDVTADGSVTYVLSFRLA